MMRYSFLVSLLLSSFLLSGCVSQQPITQADPLLPEIDLQALCNQLSLAEVERITTTSVVLKDNPYDCLYVNSDGVLVVGFGPEKRSLDAIKQTEEDLQRRIADRMGENYVSGSVREINLAGSRAIYFGNTTYNLSPKLYWERDGQTFHMFLGLGSVQGYNKESWLAILTNLAQATD